MIQVNRHRNLPELTDWNQQTVGDLGLAFQGCTGHLLLTSPSADVVSTLCPSSTFERNGGYILQTYRELLYSFISHDVDSICECEHWKLYIMRVSHGGVGMTYQRNQFQYLVRWSLMETIQFRSCCDYCIIFSYGGWSSTYDFPLYQNYVSTEWRDFTHTTVTLK